MALRFHLLPSNHLPKSIKFQFHTHHHPFPASASTSTSTSTSLLPISKFQIACSDTDNRIRDLELALDFARKVEKLSTEFEHKQEAVNKSTQILVNELCDYLNLGTDEFMRKWGQLDEDAKLVLVKGFVSEWGADFHPLSARSAKELVDEYCVDNSTMLSPQSLLFSGLKKFFGFNFNNKE